MLPKKHLLFLGCLIAVLGCDSSKNKRFELVESSASGVSFVNRNEYHDSLNILDYLYYYNGAGMAEADINNDGLPDLYFVSNQGDNRFYLNQGGLRFEDITPTAKAQGNTNCSTGVVMTDVNCDGYLDIYVSTVTNHTPVRSGNLFPYGSMEGNFCWLDVIISLRHC